MVFNIKCLGVPHKKIYALDRFVRIHIRDIILIQETMMEGGKVKKYLSYLLKDEIFCLLVIQVGLQR